MMSSLRRGANARNVSFRISFQWPIHIINPVDKTRLSCYTSHRRSTTVHLETYYFYVSELLYYALQIWWAHVAFWGLFHSYCNWGRQEENAIGPLHDLVTWYGINYTGTQVTRWDFQNKGTRTSPARLSFVLKVPPRNLRPSVIYSVPCDWIVQRAHPNLDVAFTNACATVV